MSVMSRPTLTGLPVLETERLVLRAPQASDWPTFRDYRASDRTVFTGGKKTEVQAAEQFASFFGHWVMRGFGRLIAEERATRAPLGHFGPLQWADAAEVELTWSLWTAAAEGRGLATEAAVALRDWVFGPLGLPRVRAEVARDNAASHAVARRLGGQAMPDLSPKWVGPGTVYHFTHGATT